MGTDHEEQPLELRKKYAVQNTVADQSKSHTEIPSKLASESFTDPAGTTFSFDESHLPGAKRPAGTTNSPDIPTTFGRFKMKGDARTASASIYNWFQEGFDAPDLIDAKQLLDSL